MLDDIRKLDSQLSPHFKKLLFTALLMLLVAFIGYGVAFLSYGIGYTIATVGIFTGNACLLGCFILRVLGKHRA